MIFWPFDNVLWVENFPESEGVITVSTPFIRITIIVSPFVCPETVIVSSVTTSSSLGWFRVKRIEGMGVGVGDMIETVFV